MLDKKRNLRVYERDNLYPQSISFYFPLFEHKTEKYVANHWEVGCFEDGYFWWARDVDMLEESFNMWFSQWLSDSDKKDELFSQFKGDYKNFIKEFWEIKNIDVKNLTDKDLYYYYNKVLKRVFYVIEYAEYTVDMFDDFFGKIFFHYLKSFECNIENQDFNKFFVPASISSSNVYKNKLLELSLQVEKEINFSEIINEFSWIQMSWDGEGVLAEEDVKKEIEEIDKIDKQERINQFKKLSNYSQSVKEVREYLIKKYNLDGVGLQGYFDLLDNFNTFHDYRKEIQMRANQLIYSYLREISRRFNIEYKNLLFYQNQEIKLLVLDDKKLDDKILEERKKGMLWFIEEGHVSKYFGGEAMEKLDKLVLAPTRAENREELQGFSASPGEFTGEVFVVKDAKKANQKIKEGQILVTSMTTVDFLPAMKRAGAIITDDGGITCHAAIVSRELGIPCVVGTKMATQVLKTGDAVFVDANNGIIRKI